MSEFHDDRTAASDAVHVSLSSAKLRQFHPELFGLRAWITTFRPRGQSFTAAMARRMIAEHVRLGDSRAALVVCNDPLLVAAYTDEQDCVLLLRFPQWVAAEYNLGIGSKLLTVNTYERGNLAADIVEGPNSTGRWGNVYPIIAQFVSDDRSLIERRVRDITAMEWQRTAALADAFMARPNFTSRDGRPLRSMFVGTSIK